MRPTINAAAEQALLHFSNVLEAMPVGHSEKPAIKQQEVNLRNAKTEQAARTAIKQGYLFIAAYYADINREQYTLYSNLFFAAAEGDQQPATAPQPTSKPRFYETTRANRATNALVSLAAGSFEECLAIYTNEVSQLHAQGHLVSEEQFNLLDGRVSLQIRDEEGRCICQVFCDDFEQPLQWGESKTPPVSHDQFLETGGTLAERVQHTAPGFARFRSLGMSAGKLAGVQVFCHLDTDGNYWACFQMAGQMVTTNGAASETRALSQLLAALADLLPLPNFANGAAA